MAALKSSKNQVSSILLRHGYVRNRKTARGNLKSTWTREYVSRAKSADPGGGNAKGSSTSAYHPPRRTTSGFGRLTGGSSP